MKTARTRLGLGWLLWSGFHIAAGAEFLGLAVGWSIMGLAGLALFMLGD